MQFARLDDEGVELVVMEGEAVAGFARGLASKGLLRERLDFAISCVRLHEAVADRDAAEVLVDHHGGDAKCIEQDGVRGLRTDAGECKKLMTHDGRIGMSVAAEPGHAAAVMCIEEGDEGFEGGGFAQHEAGGADEVAEFGFRNGSEAADG